MARAAARRRIWRSARSARVVRPGHAAAVGKQRATTEASRSTTSMSAPPMYEATALIPIRASVLRRPASKAAIRWPTVSVGVRVSAPRDPASSAASSMARRGWTAVAPTARTMAMAWTSRMSTALTAMSVRPRRPAAVSAVWTAPVARIDGIGSRSIDHAASVSTRSVVSPRAAATASAASRSRAAPRPSGPPAGSQVASSVRIVPRSIGHRREQARQVDDDRSLEALGPGRPRQPAEQCRAAAQLDPQVHHHALALGIDGGVGDLGECLAQVVGDRPVEAAAARASACRRPCSTAARGPRGPSS